MRIVVVTLVVYTTASSSTVVQDLHTALGWIACTEVRRGFAEECFIDCVKDFGPTNSFWSLILFRATEWSAGR